MKLTQHLFGKTLQTHAHVEFCRNFHISNFNNYFIYRVLAELTLAMESWLPICIENMYNSFWSKSADVEFCKNGLQW